MPTKKARINLSVDDDLNKLITDLSVLMDLPKATVITDFLDDIKPALIDLRDALQLAKEKKSVVSHLAKMAANANNQTAIINTEMADFYGKQPDLLETDK